MNFRQMPNSDSSMVYIVIVNWNGWRDTVCCLASLYNMNYKKFKVIICDNGSADQSVSMISNWANGNIIPDRKDSPVRFKDNAEVSCRVINYECATNFGYKLPDISIIDAKDNIGFAAGCNIATKLAITQGDAEFIWYLNNDTVVDQNSLNVLVDSIKSDRSIGICGSLLLFYKEPHVIQALGGVYNKLSGTSYHFLEGEKFSDEIISEISTEVNYVVGASMLCLKSLIDHIGLLSEDYFLYNEEIDFAIRANNAGFKISHAAMSRVFHKVGGSVSKLQSKTRRIDFYVFRNRLLTARKFHFGCLPVIVMRLIGVLVLSALRGDITKLAFFFDLSFWFGKGKNPRY